METIFVKPMEGGLVIDPDTNLPLDANGAVVPRNTFWLRRVTDGSVTVEQPKQTTAKAKKEE